MSSWWNFTNVSRRVTLNPSETPPKKLKKRESFHTHFSRPVLPLTQYQIRTL
jgi:hypothetical protein